MHGQILWGVVLLVATTFVHAGFTGLLLWILKRVYHHPWARRSLTLQTAIVAGVVVALFLSSLAEAVLWAGTYVHLGVLQTFEQALYFSIVTYTTLGFGDITLNQQWRILSAFEAANGTILFGWSTALLYAFVQRVIHIRESAPDSVEA